MEKNIPHNNDWQKRLRQQPYEFDPGAWEDMERLLDKEEDRKGGYLTDNGHGKWIVGYMILFLMLSVVAGAWYQSGVPAEKISSQEVRVATVGKEVIENKTGKTITEEKEMISDVPAAIANKSKGNKTAPNGELSKLNNEAPGINNSSKSNEGQNVNNDIKSIDESNKIKEEKSPAIIPTAIAKAESPEKNNDSIIESEKKSLVESTISIEKKTEGSTSYIIAKEDRLLISAMDLVPIKNDPIDFTPEYNINKNLITPNPPRSRIAFGVYAGPSLRTLNTVRFALSNNGGETERAQNFDYSLGVFARKSISRRLSLQAALEVSQSKYRYAILGIDSVPGSGSFTPVYTNTFNYLERSTYRTINFDLPVTLHYHLKNGFRVFAGLGTQYHFNRTERSNEDDFLANRGVIQNLNDEENFDYDNRAGATVNSTAGLSDFKLYGMAGVGYTKGRWNIDLSLQHSLFYNYKLKGFEKGMNKIKLNEFGANLRVGYRLF